MIIEIVIKSRNVVRALVIEQYVIDRITCHNITVTKEDGDVVVDLPYYHRLK